MFADSFLPADNLPFSCKSKVNLHCKDFSASGLQKHGQSLAYCPIGFTLLGDITF